MAQSAVLLSGINVSSLGTASHRSKSLRRKTRELGLFQGGSVCQEPSCTRDSPPLKCRAALVPELEREQPRNYRPTAVAVAPPPKKESAVSARDADLVEGGAVIVRDDLDMLLQVLPSDIRDKLLRHGRRAELLEVVLDLGRRPEARFLDLGNGQGGGEYLRDQEVTRADLIAAQEAVGDFGGDNRAGVEGTLHRISAIRNRREDVVGLTCRVGRAVTGHIDMVRDILSSQQGILFLGRPGVGKTTVIREMARVLADDFHKRVVIVDTSNEIGGDGDVPHPAIGGARRMQVRDPSQQHRVMIEAVENHMPEVVIVDEIGTEAEALACRSIAERGVQLVGTAHGQMLENLIKNPTLSDLVGGIQSVTLGDEEARNRGTQKSVLERKGPPTFPLVVEMRERNNWVVHQTDRSVDALLHGKRPTVEMRTRDAKTFEVVVDRRSYDSWGNGKLDHEFDYASATEGSTMMNTLRGRQASRQSNLLESTYEWAVKMGKVPADREAFGDLSMDDFMAAAGYDQAYHSPTPGKRGSRRGSRGSFNSSYRPYEEF